MGWACKRLMTINDMKNSYIISLGNPEGKRPLGEA
jgi:hypothetical protein